MENLPTKEHKKYRYVHRTITRHGRVAYYFWVPPGRKIRLPDEIGSEEFRSAYYLAYSGIGRTEQRTAALEKRVKTYVKRGLIKAKRRAIEYNREFSLDFDWAINRIERCNYRCELTGIHFFETSGDGHRAHPFAPSFDRINCAEGYTNTNTRIIVLALNVALSDWGVPIFEVVSQSYNGFARGRAMLLPKIKGAENDDEIAMETISCKNSGRPGGPTKNTLKTPEK